VKELVWFNVSVLYSAICAAFAVESAAGTKRLVLVFLAVHGALWAVYRAGDLLRKRARSERR
jgi:hypothetical protein